MRHRNLGARRVCLRRRVSRSLRFFVTSRLLFSVFLTRVGLFSLSCRVWTVRRSSSLAPSLLPPFFSWQLQKSHHSFTIGCSPMLVSQNNLLAAKQGNFSATFTHDESCFTSSIATHFICNSNLSHFSCWILYLFIY